MRDQNYPETEGSVFMYPESEQILMSVGPDWSWSQERPLTVGGIFIQSFVILTS